MQNWPVVVFWLGDVYYFSVSKLSIVVFTTTLSTGKLKVVLFEVNSWVFTKLQLPKRVENTLAQFEMFVQSTVVLLEHLPKQKIESNTDANFLLCVSERMSKRNSLFEHMLILFALFGMLKTADICVFQAQFSDIARGTIDWKIIKVSCSPIEVAHQSIIMEMYLKAAL